MGMSAGSAGDGRGPRLDARDADAPADVGTGGRGPLEQVVVELAADDAIAGGTAPSRLVAPAVELDHAGVERLDRQRVLFGGDLEVSQRLGGHPARADLDPGEHPPAQAEYSHPRAGQPPARGAPP